MPVVDTLKLKTRLSESGMPESQAQVLVKELDDVLSTAIAREAATKADVVELRAAIGGLEERLGDLKADFGNLKADFGNLKADFGNLKADFGDLKGEIRLLRWMVGFVGAGVLAILVRLFFTGGP